MTIKTSYQNHQNFQSNKDFIFIYTPNDSSEIIKKIIDGRKGALSYKDLAEGTGVSVHYIKMFYEGKHHNKINLLTLYKLTRIIHQRCMSKNFAKGYTKIKVVNPLRFRKLMGEEGITLEDIVAFVQGALTTSKIIHNLRKKVHNFETSIAFTACHQHYKNLEIKQKKKDTGLAPNTVRLRRKNDAIERYRSGYVPSVQQKVRKTS